MARARIPPRLSARKWRGAYVYKTFNRTCQSTKAVGTSITGAGGKQLRKCFKELEVEESNVNEMIARFFWTHTVHFLEAREEMVFYTYGQKNDVVHIYCANHPLRAAASSQFSFRPRHESQASLRPASPRPFLDERMVMHICPLMKYDVLPQRCGKGYIRKEEVLAAFREPPEEDIDGVEFERADASPESSEHGSVYEPSSTNSSEDDAEAVRPASYTPRPPPLATPTGVELPEGWFPVENVDEVRYAPDGRRVAGVNWRRSYINAAFLDPADLQAIDIEARRKRAARRAGAGAPQIRRLAADREPRAPELEQAMHEEEEDEESIKPVDQASQEQSWCFGQADALFGKLFLVASLGL